jgi:hypothetical protein
MPTGSAVLIEDRNKAGAFEWRIAKLNEVIVAAGNRSDRRLVLETDKTRLSLRFPPISAS